MATPIDPRRRAAIDALMTAGWADATDVAGRIADVVIAAVDKVGWDAHVDSALSVLNEPTDADVVTLYDDQDRRWVSFYSEVQDDNFPFPDNASGTYYTVTGELNRLVNARVTEETVHRLCEESGEESANYIVQDRLRRDERWKFVRFDSESGQFFAYTRTSDEAIELRDYIEGLTWVMPNKGGS